MKKTTLSLLIIAIAITSSAQKKEIKRLYKDLPFKMAEIKPIKFPKNKLYITSFGAKADGIFDNTEAFAKAIDALSTKGGGTLVVPEGLWLTGPIVFKSNINLHIEKNALIIFSKDKSKYPIVKTSFEGFDTRRCMSPIYGVNLKNIAITGEGVLDGSGEVWRAVKKEKLTSKQWKTLVASGGLLNEKGNTWYPSESYKKGLEFIKDQNVPNISDEAKWEEIKDFLRPVMLSFISCENVLLDGVTFQNSPAWCVHPLMCTNVTITNLTIRNPWFSQNGDGLDLESCKNSLIYNCSFDVGDDAICIKSGKDADGRKRAIPCENVIVSKCVVYHGHGGFVVGSEMSSGVKNIDVSDCLFMGTDVGLRFKSTRGRGGVVENIYIRDINMINIPTDAVLFDLFYGGKSASEVLEDTTKNAEPKLLPVTEETPIFRNIFIKNVSCNGARRAMYFNGLPEMNVQNINVSNSAFTTTNGVELNESDGVKINNVIVNPAQGPIVKLYNVKNVVLDKVSSSSPEKDLIKVDGKTTSNILIKNSAIKKENIQSSVAEGLIKQE